MGNIGNRDLITQPLTRSEPAIAISAALDEAADHSDLFPPLHDSIDVDALRTLLANPDNGIFIKFDHAGYSISMGDGEVGVAPD